MSVDSGELGGPGQSRLPGQTRLPGEGRLWIGYVLVATGVLAGLAGVVLLAVGNWPAGGTGRTDPDPWLGRLAVVAGLVWPVWALAQLDRLPARRVLAGGVVAAGSAVAAVSVIRGAPTLGVATSLDISFPLTVLGLACLGAGALATVLANLPRLVGPPGERKWLSPGGRWWVAVAGAVLVGALVAPLAVVAVPHWTAAANIIAASTTGQPAPGGPPPALDGTVAWQEAGGFRPSGQVVGTAGGLALVSDRGPSMRHPADGRQRWSYHRADLRAWPRHRPSSVATGGDGRWLAVGFDTTSRRELAVNERRAHRRVLVFDAVSGAVRTNVRVSDDSSGLHVVDGDGVLVSEGRDVPETGQRAHTLVMLDRAGEVDWRTDLAPGCRPERTEILPDGDLLVQPRCQAPPDTGSNVTSFALVRLERDDGRVQWRVPINLSDHPESPQQRDYDSAFLRPAWQVVDGRVVLDLRVFYQREADPGVREQLVRHRLRARGLADGELVWTQPARDFGALNPRSDASRWVGALWPAGDQVAFTEVGYVSGGESSRAPVRLATFDQATGALTERELLPAVNLPDSTPLAHAVLPDGRLVLAYQDRTVPAAESCRVGIWDLAAGAEPETAPEILRPAALGQIDAEWCRTYELALRPVAGGVAVVLTDPGLTPDQLVVLG